MKILSLTHFSSAQGAIYKIIHDKEDVSAEKVTLLPGAPTVVTVERNERGYFAFLIVTNYGLLSFNPKFGEMKVLAIDQFWHGLYPTSAQLLNSQFIIGMRSGVAVVSLGQSIGMGSSPRVTKIQYFSQKAQSAVRDSCQVTANCCRSQYSKDCHSDGCSISVAPNPLSAPLMCARRYGQLSTPP